VLVVISCGGGGGDDKEEVPNLITINSVAQNPTQASLVNLSGTRSSTVNSVTWSNAAGGSGTAALAADTCGFPLPFPVPCNERWTATIPLVVGDNLITVIGYGGIDEFTRLTTTIRRTPWPQNAVCWGC